MVNNQITTSHLIQIKYTATYMMVLQETLLYLYQFIPLIELAHLAGLKELLPRHERYQQGDACIMLIRFSWAE